MLTPLRPPCAAAEGSESAPVASPPAGFLFLSYHSLPSLILALAQWEAGLCDGDEGLLGSNHSNFLCRVELSAGKFPSMTNVLPSYI